MTKKPRTTSFILFKHDFFLTFIRKQDCWEVCPIRLLLKASFTFQLQLDKLRSVARIKVNISLQSLMSQD